MNFINRPNLPDNKVKLVLCDCRIGKDIQKEINLSGCKILFVPLCKNVDYPISAHPDIHVFHFGGNSYISSGNLYDVLNEYFYNLEANKDCEKINNIRVKKELSSNYPGDVLLNAVSVGKYIICNKKTVHKKIIETEKNVIHVEQGYTKCSVAVVSENAIITDDIGIYNSVKNYLDVLLISRGEIILRGYNYGFIGGTCGKLSNDCLAFFGDVKRIKSYASIDAFCKNHGVYCTSLSSNPLTDFGSIIPMLE